MLLTFLSTVVMFLFQVANATFQPANRIDPNAPDQQQTVVGAHWGWALLVCLVAAALVFFMVYKARTAKSPGSGYINKG